MSFGPRREQLRERARKMRKHSTRAERKLWSRLRRKQLLGKKFRRQHILQPYIVDFYCASEKIVLEIDGLTHDCAEASRDDARRTGYLKKHYGVQVLRFTDCDVMDNIESVLQRIAVVIEQSVAQ